MKISTKKTILVLLSIITIVSIIFINLKPAPIEAKNTKAKEIINKRADPNAPEPKPTKKEKVWTKEALEEQFSHLNDTNLILDIPDGGYLLCENNENSSCHFTTKNMITGKITSEYNLKTDPRAMTVKEFKEYMVGKPIDYEE